MTSASGRYTVVYNGELYNHLEMRSELTLAGRTAPWRGGSDTETLLAGIEAWGLRDLLARSIGMFAIALWDRQERRLTLARDRMGEKPLSYAHHGPDLLFASQPTALREARGFSPTIDRDALADLLRYGQVPGARTIHHEVRTLPPGTLLEVTVDRSDHVTSVGTPEPWWSFIDVARAGVRAPLTGSDSAITDEVEDAVTGAVRSQLISDVPLGAFLSGGIDSSLVVATMQRLTARPVRTFTIGFSEQRYDESPFARAVAQHLGTDHTELIVSPEDALATIPDLPRHYDEPFADASQLPTLLVSRLARGSVTVSLSGDGGDELFGGYGRYARAERYARVPRPVALAAMLALRSVGQQRKASAAAALGRGPEVAVRRLLSANPAADTFVLGADARANAARFHSAWAATEGLGSLTERFMALDTTGYLPTTSSTRSTVRRWPCLSRRACRCSTTGSSRWPGDCPITSRSGMAWASGSCVRCSHDTSPEPCSSGPRPGSVSRSGRGCAGRSGRGRTDCSHRTCSSRTGCSIRSASDASGSSTSRAAGMPATTCGRS
jgi:asparagine synthase (glutamine-hydrolysing)